MFLNTTIFWDGIPRDFWEYTLGGYQVLKKWLSYREREILGRSLRPEEAMDFTNNARRISAILALRPRLDAHYAACRSDAYTAPTREGRSRRGRRPSDQKH